MSIDSKRLLAVDFPEVTQKYDQRDCILYALGLGLGLDPVDADELSHVLEGDLRVLPTMATVLASPGFWMRDLDTGMDASRVVHGEHELILHRPLPPSASVRARTKITDIFDKGAGRAAIVRSVRQIHDVDSGELLATNIHTAVCKGQGGFGGSSGNRKDERPLPERAPDKWFDFRTSPQGALIYRLSGDPNPLHADPATARSAGYPRPILHGLATFGIAGFAISQLVCKCTATRLASLFARFSTPVFPGETLRTEVWVGPDSNRFRVRVLDRGVVAISGGRFETAAIQ